MTIIRTSAAQCDETLCSEQYGLDTDDPQPYISLVRAGWSFEIETKSIKTYCPMHPGGVA